MMTISDTLSIVYMIALPPTMLAKGSGKEARQDTVLFIRKIT